MISGGVEIFYYTQPVDSQDQAVSLTEYLTRHGVTSFATEGDEVSVIMECETDRDAADKSATVFGLVSSWRKFWTHSDSGVFELPVYVKD